LLIEGSRGRLRIDAGRGHVIRNQEWEILHEVETQLNRRRSSECDVEWQE